MQPQKTSLATAKKRPPKQCNWKEWTPIKMLSLDENKLNKQFIACRKDANCALIIEFCCEIEKIKVSA